MQETAQQYIARILETLGGRDPLTVLTETPARLRLLVSGATPDQLTWKPEPGRWPIAEIVAHLADAEVVGAWRFRSVLAHDGVPLAAYDQNEWAAAFRYDQVPVTESLVLFEALRAGTLNLLKRVDPARYTHVGMHAERGPESITRLMEMYAGHDLNHLGQIERYLDQSRGVTARSASGA